MSMMDRGAREANMESAARSGYGKVAEQERRIVQLEIENRALLQTILTISESGGEGIALARTVVEAYKHNDRDLKIECAPRSHSGSNPSGEGQP